MTDSHIGALRERTPGQLCFGFFALFCLFLILRNPDVAIEYITSGLRLCANRGYSSWRWALCVTAAFCRRTYSGGEPSGLYV